MILKILKDILCGVWGGVVGLKKSTKHMEGVGDIA